MVIPTPSEDGFNIEAEPGCLSIVTANMSMVQVNKGRLSSLIDLRPYIENGPTIVAWEINVIIECKIPWLTKCDNLITCRPGSRLNKKDGLTRYGDSHVKDKTS